MHTGYRYQPVDGVKNRSKNNKKDVLISLVKYGLDQSEELWRELQQKGIESINRKLREDIWELLRDNGYISAFSDEEKEYLFKHYANTAFDLRLSASSPPEEAAMVSRVPWTICRGETKVCYTETIYSHATPVKNSLLTYECGLYTRSGTRGLYCDIAT